MICNILILLARFRKMGRHGFFTQRRFPLATILALALFILQRMGGHEEAMTTPNNIKNIEQINTLTTIFNNLQIPQVRTQIVPPTLPNIQVDKSKKWNALTYPITNLPQNDEIPPLPNYETNKPLKFPPQYCYYTDGSFLPPQQIDDS